MKNLDWPEFPHAPFRCIIWPGKSLRVRHEGKLWYVPRLLTFLATGEDVHHRLRKRCNTPNCVNPRHWSRTAPISEDEELLFDLLPGAETWADLIHPDLPNVKELVWNYDKKLYKRLTKASARSGS